MGVDLLITDDAAAIGPAVVPGHDGGRLGRART
jgi:hypothetical protein